MSESSLLINHKFHDCGGGKQMRYALFEAPNPRGTILIAPGRREFIEKKYAELADGFLQRNFRLVFFEWRGQGLSDRFLSGTKRQRDHATDFNIHLDDLSSFYAKVVQPYQTGPLILSGHSMGSHLLLRWLVERQPRDIAGAILTAPMLALASVPAQTIARGMTWTSMRLGHGMDYAPAQHDYNVEDRTFAKNPLTHDPERFAIMEKYFGAHPELTVGGVTWGWLDASLKSMHDMHHRAYFERLSVPVLAITGGADQVTPPSELDHLIKRMPKGQHQIVPKAFHDIMNESDMYRLQAWKHIDMFLECIMPA
jgi:lysophospholipase